MPKQKAISKNTPGYYLREIRKMYALDQDDLTGGNVKRSKIAKIEINDPNTVLTEDYAKEIASNINKIIASKYNEQIDYMYFYDNTIYKVKERSKAFVDAITSCYAKNDSKGFAAAFSSFINEFSYYDIPDVKLMVYRLAGRFYYGEREYHKAYIYFSKAIDNAVTTNSLDELIKCKISLYACLFDLGDIEESIKYFNEMLEVNHLTDQQLFYVYSNLGEAYIKSHNYLKAIESFEKCSQYIDYNPGFIAEYYMKMAYCYKKLNDIDMAIKISVEGLERIQLLEQDDSMNRELFYTRKLSIIKNLISSYKCKNDKDSMNHYITQITKMMTPLGERPTKYVIEVYNDLIEDCMFLDNYEHIHIYCNEALRLSIQLENFDCINKSLQNLYFLYVKYEKISNIKLLVPRVCSLLTKYPDKIDNNIVVFTLLKHYFEVDQNSLGSEMKDLLKCILKEDTDEETS